MNFKKNKMQCSAYSKNLDAQIVIYQIKALIPKYLFTLQLKKIQLN